MRNSSYYIALVGKNPLPIYTSVLNYGENCKNIILIATSEEKDSIGTVNVAINIKKQLKLKIGDLKIKIEQCSKSSLKSIQNKFRMIVKEIEDECEREYIDKENISLILDYTGGTKIMSAVCYSELQHVSKNHGIKCTSVYVSYFNHCIREYEAGKNRDKNIPVGRICRKYNIKKEDIINLHHGNYVSSEIKDRVICNQKCDLKFSMDFHINRDNFCLVANVKSNAQNGSQMVKSYFQIKNIAEKSGGSNVEIILNINEMYDGKKRKDTEGQVRYFRQNISEIYDSSERERLKIYCEGEEVI